MTTICFLVLLLVWLRNSLCTVCSLRVCLDVYVLCTAFTALELSSDGRSHGTATRCGKKPLCSCYPANPRDYRGG